MELPRDIIQRPFADLRAKVLEVFEVDPDSEGMLLVFEPDTGVLLWTGHPELTVGQVFEEPADSGKRVEDLAAQVPADSILTLRLPGLTLYAGELSVIKLANLLLVQISNLREPKATVH